MVPPGKVVVLGLVASKVSELETADLLKRRIEEASRYIRLEQLALSPQCGFSTSAAEHVGISEAMERAKLARIVEGAREVWGARPPLRVLRASALCEQTADLTQSLDNRRRATPPAP